MDRGRVDNLCEKAVLILVVAGLALGVLVFGGVRNEELAIIAGLVVVATGIWLVRVWMSRTAELHWPPMCWGVLLMVVYALAIYPYAPVEYAARSELFRVLLYALIFFLVLDNARGHRVENLFAYTLIAIASVVSIYAVYQFLSRSNLVWDFVRPAQYGGRGSGTYICPNHLAGFLEMTLPLGLAYLFHGRASATMKTLIGYSVLIMAAGLAVTLSRGGWLSCGISLAVFFGILFVRSWGMRLPVLLAMAVIIAGGVFFVLKNTMASSRIEVTTQSGKIDDLRLRIWQSAAGLWEDNPWIGAGPGQFQHQFRSHRPEKLQMHPARVHNDYLNTLADWGAIGLAIVLGAWVGFGFVCHRAWRHIRRDKDDLAAKTSDRMAFLLGVSTGMIALAVHSLVDFNFHIPANASIAIALAALVCAQVRGARVYPMFRLETGGKLVLTAISALCCVWLVQESLTKHHEGRLITASRDSSYSPEQRQACLLKAHAFDPMNPWTVFSIGENIREAWWERDHSYHEPMKEAIGWFERAQQLDPHYSFALLRAGMCHDHLWNFDEAEAMFLKANELDPNGANTAAYLGWHWVQVDDFKQAREHLRRALYLSEGNSQLALEYLQILDEIAPEGVDLKAPALLPGNSKE
ncbi:MAG: hypothetical protein CMO80_15010 [Verrucomicrobiales bacterium]|nr:hypothetical protein [Verrucomicrobiales bacterium]